MFRMQRSEQRTDRIFLMQMHRPGNASRAQAGPSDAVQSGRGGGRIYNMDEVRKTGERTTPGTGLIMDRVV